MRWLRLLGLGYFGSERVEFSDGSVHKVVLFTGRLGGMLVPIAHVMLVNAALTGSMRSYVLEHEYAHWLRDGRSRSSSRR